MGLRKGCSRVTWGIRHWGRSGVGAQLPCIVLCSLSVSLNPEHCGDSQLPMSEINLSPIYHQKSAVIPPVVCATFAETLVWAGDDKSLSSRLGYWGGHC